MSIEFGGIHPLGEKSTFNPNLPNRRSRSFHPTAGGIISMSKHAEAELILKLYDLRREETMRQARDWFFRDFNPETIADFNATLFGEHSGHMRMVMSYWDMAAALVNHGAISLDLFTDTNGEYIGVFSKLEK